MDESEAAAAMVGGEAREVVGGWDYDGRRGRSGHRWGVRH